MNNKKQMMKPVTKPVHKIVLEDIIDTDLVERSKIINNFNKILYINLDSRLDRNYEMKKQFETFDIPEEKIIRISAVHKTPGYLGCSESHIKCLEYAIENNLKNVLILEDDFNFINNVNYVYTKLKNINNLDKWDVILLSGNVIKSIPYDNVFDKAIEIQTTSGYIVNSDYYSKLLNNFKEGLTNLKKTNIYTKYAIDQYWKILQPSDNWYIFHTKLGFQRESYSDIENRITSYGC
jgi:hypothetical protein